MSEIHTLDPSGAIPPSMLPPDVRELLGPAVEDNNRRWNQIKTEFERTSGEVQKHPDLNDKGKRSQTEILAQKAAQAADDVLENKLPGLAKLRSGLVSALPTWPAPPEDRIDKLILELRQNEIRNHYERIEPTRRQIEINSLIDTGDAHHVSALLNSPVAGKFIKTSAAEEVRQRVLRAQNPAPFKKLDSFDVAIALMKTGRNHVLGKFGFSPEQIKLRDARARNDAGK